MATSLFYEAKVRVFVGERWSLDDRTLDRLSDAIANIDLPDLIRQALENELVDMGHDAGKLLGRTEFRVEVR